MELVKKDVKWVEMQERLAALLDKWNRDELTEGEYVAALLEFVTPQNHAEIAIELPSRIQEALARRSVPKGVKVSWRYRWREGYSETLHGTVFSDVLDAKGRVGVKCDRFRGDDWWVHPTELTRENAT